MGNTRKYLIKRVNINNSYDYYVGVGHDRIANLVLYTEIVYGFIKFIMRKVFEGYDVDLSGGNSLGSIGIRGRKIKPKVDTETGEIRGLAISWAKTKELRESNPQAAVNNEVVYCLNEHSNGIRYRLIWHKNKIALKFKHYYGLNFSRANKRMLSKLINEGREYLVMQ